MNSRPIIQWTTDYAVGIPQIDGEHKRLFTLVEKLHQAMVRGRAREILQSLFSELVDYTCYQFEHEEALMKRIGYPGYAEQCREHEDLRVKVRGLQNRYSRGELAISIDTCNFLRVG